MRLMENLQAKGLLFLQHFLEESDGGVEIPVVTVQSASVPYYCLTLTYAPECELMCKGFKNCARSIASENLARWSSTEGRDWPAICTGTEVEILYEGKMSVCWS